VPVKREIWQTSYDNKFSTALPCPRCETGMVRRGNEAVLVKETEYSKINHTDENFDPDWIRESFATLLTCDNHVCGEIVAVSGRAGVEYVYDEDECGRQVNSGLDMVLRPVSMYPAPPLFHISEKFPEEVKIELKLAFQLFWADLSASTSRLRTSLERVLDERRVDKEGKNKKGEVYRLSLRERIDLFEQKTNDPDSAESMKALRIVGNIGTHGNHVARDDYFNLLDVYEAVLLELYEQRQAMLKAKKQALIELDNKY
jgi:hypothetical protein